MQCEPKKMIAVISISGIGRLPADIKFEDMPRELQNIVDQHEELLRRMAERENRLMGAMKRFSESVAEFAEKVTTDLVLIGGCVKEIENPPLWRQTRYSPELRRLTPSSRRMKRNIGRMIIRGSLWSGQRKRQVADGQ